MASEAALLLSPEGGYAIAITVSLCVCLSVCLCVCVRERERERDCRIAEKLRKHLDEHFTCSFFYMEDTTKEQQK